MQNLVTKLSLCFFILFNLNTGSSVMAQFIPRDKQLHLAAGAGISTISYFAIYKISNKKRNASFWLGLSGGVLAGLAKELYDAQGYGHPSTMDVVATGVGAFVPSVTLRILMHKKKEPIPIDFGGELARD